jgi:hypothetical protein
VDRLGICCERLTFLTAGGDPGTQVETPAEGAAMPERAIEVRSHYVGVWASGFEIAETTPDGFRVRRQSDGALLPGVFPPEDVREFDRS